MNNRGAVLIISWIVIVVSSILGAAFLTRSITENNLAGKYYDSTQAFWLAEAGIQGALWELNYNDCKGCVKECYEAEEGKSKCIFKLTLKPYGYDADVIIDKNTNILTSTGSILRVGNFKPVVRTLEVKLRLDSPFRGAAFARSKIRLLNNAMTDSYDSSLGLYGVNGNVSQYGDVGTNSGLENDITLGNNAIVKGDASTGPGGTVQMNNNATVTGDITHSNNVSIPPVEIPPDLTKLPNLGAMNIANNGSREISEDSHYTSINMANNSTLIINGTVNLYLSSITDAITTQNNSKIILSEGAKLNLYVGGVVSISNNSAINNKTKIPANFQLYSAYTGSNGVRISNNGNFYGAVYAPGTDIILANNSDSFGSFVGKTIDLSNNGNIHYDLALQQLSAPGFSGGSGVASYILEKWQEV